MRRQVESTVTKASEGEKKIRNVCGTQDWTRIQISGSISSEGLD